MPQQPASLLLIDLSGGPISSPQPWAHWLAFTSSAKAPTGNMPLSAPVTVCRIYRITHVSTFLVTFPTVAEAEAALDEH